MRLRLLLLIFLWLVACQIQHTEHHQKFAKRIEIVGVENLARINPNLYRGAQPTKEGFANLKALGIKTVINLRSHHTDKDVCRELGLRYYQIKIDLFKPPDPDQIEQFMQIVTNPENQPVFFHCHLGKDRTGVMAAVFRIVHDGWTNEEALAEMQYFGFHDFYQHLKGYIEDFRPIPDYSG